MKDLRSHFVKIYPYGLLLLMSLLMFSCSGQVKSNTDDPNQPVISHLILSKKKDPLFFIDGQLCQHLRKIFQDSKGNLWFGTNVYGIMKFDGNKLVYFEEKDGVDDSRITGITEDKEGNVWFSSFLGLTKYDGHTFRNIKEKDGYGENESWCLLQDSKGIFWIGTNNGVSRYDGQSFSNLDVPKKQVQDPNVIYSPDRIVSIVEDKNGHLWFGTDGFGICRYDGKTFTNFTTEDGLCDNTIHEMMVDTKGNLWIGTYWGGVGMYDGNKFTNFTKDGIISGVEASGFYEDKKGNIWFAVENNGVYRYNGQSFTNFNDRDGLNTNGILTIFQDREDRFWFGGWGGLFRFDGSTFTSVTEHGPWDK